MYNVTIDWISLTFHPKPEDQNAVLSLFSRSGVLDVDKARFGYDRAGRTEEGAILYTSSVNRDMGVHAVISGSALLSYSANGCTPTQLLERALRVGGKITRLDLAKDARDETFDLASLEKQISERDFVGRVQKAASIRSTDGGMTIYVGSRQSNKFLRIYNKGVESKTGEDWIRAEMELKSDTAHIVGKLISEGEDMNNLFTSLARRQCDVNNADWQKMLSADARIGVPKVERQSDREAWIAKQVTPAVADYGSEHPESVALRRLYEVLQRIVNEDNGRGAAPAEG